MFDLTFNVPLPTIPIEFERLNIGHGIISADNPNKYIYIEAMLSTPDKNVEVYILPGVINNYKLDALGDPEIGHINGIKLTGTEYDLNYNSSHLKPLDVNNDGSQNLRFLIPVDKADPDKISEDTYSLYVKYDNDGNESYRFRTLDTFNVSEGSSDITTSIRDIEAHSPVSYYVYGNQISTGESDLEIFDIFGRKLACMSANQSCILDHGIYIIRSEGRTAKIFIK